MAGGWREAGGSPEGGRWVAAGVHLSQSEMEMKESEEIDSGFRWQRLPVSRESLIFDGNKNEGK